MSYEIVKLEDVCDVRDGTHDSPKYVVEGFPLVTSKNITDGKLNLDNVNLISKEDYDSINKRSGVNIGDIIMPMIGTIGNPHLIVENPMFAIKNVALFKPKENLINNRYLYKILLSSTFRAQLDSESRGGTQKFVSLKILRNLQIPLPLLDIQKKIADTLDKAQELIDKRKEQISALDKFLENLFLDMFGDPVSNPKGWDVKRLKEISVKILSGNTPKGGNEVYVESGITFFRSQNVWKNRLILEDIAFIDEKTHKSMNNSSLKNGDILMTKTGRINTENSSLGRAALFVGEDDSANINGHVYLIRLEKEIINKFALFILTTKEYREYIRSVCVGGIDKRQINKNHLEEFPIIYPSVDLQNEFVSILKKVEEEKIKLKASLKEMEDNFNSIMQRAFKGELF